MSLSSLLNGGTLVAVITALASVISVPAHADTYYMRLTGASPLIEGETVGKDYENWIDLDSVAWSVTADTSWTKGGGASVGKPEPGALIWTQTFDSSVPAMYSYLLTGKAVPKAVVEFVKDGNAGPVTYLQLSMEGLFFTNIAFAGDSVSGAGVFKTISMTYWPLKKDGTRDNPVAVSWDIPAGSASSTGTLASFVAGYGPGNLAPAAKALGVAFSADVISVPEPETYALLVAGLALLVFAVRRQERATARVLA